ncbi:MAG TPA: phosphate ABC transporter permease subunit PstC [Acidimicrobiales bacterium]|nr:phosphate ABC transporter permease subunit PstC [Acidimicrobiales bacterium]
MTTVEVAPPPDPAKVPRRLEPGHERSDRVFHGSALTVGLVVLAVTGAIGVFLGYQSIPTFRQYGWSFFTQVAWEPQLNKIGIAAVLVGTVEVALIAMVVTFPVALMLALFISDYAPKRLKSWLVSAVDLMAAIPSIIYGLWGFSLLEPHAIMLARWLSQYLGWIPIFKVDTDPNAAVWQQSSYTGSAFVAGLAVSMMAIPLATAVMRAVFDQAPIGEREAAMALGGTRFGVARTVVLPFGRGGIIGGTMLALGRALGETAAVLLIISPQYVIKARILESGVQTVSALIAGNFGNATKAQLSALLTAGFVLFVITIAVNSVAAAFVKRSRSGAAVEI